MTIANVTRPMPTTKPTTNVNAPKFDLWRPPRRQTKIGEAGGADSWGEWRSRTRRWREGKPSSWT